jgi:hypothetical protein
VPRLRLQGAAGRLLVSPLGAEAPRTWVQMVSSSRSNVALVRESRYRGGTRQHADEHVWIYTEAELRLGAERTPSAVLRTSDKSTSRQIREDFTEIFQELWSLVRPTAVRLHASGVRPVEESTGSDQWLPLSR